MSYKNSIYYRATGLDCIAQVFFMWPCKTLLRKWYNGFSQQCKTVYGHFTAHIQQKKHAHKECMDAWMLGIHLCLCAFLKTHLINIVGRSLRSKMSIGTNCLYNCCCELDCRELTNVNKFSVHSTVSPWCHEFSWVYCQPKWLNFKQPLLLIWCTLWPFIV